MCTWLTRGVLRNTCLCVCACFIVGLIVSTSMWYKLLPLTLNLACSVSFRQVSNSVYAPPTNYGYCRHLAPRTCLYVYVCHWFESHQEQLSFKSVIDLGVHVHVQCTCIPFPCIVAPSTQAGLAIALWVCLYICTYIYCEKHWELETEH